MGFFQRLLFWRGTDGRQAPAAAAEAPAAAPIEEDLPCRPPNVTDSWVPAQAAREDPLEVKARIMQVRGVAFRQVVVDTTRCTACGHCADVCPDRAITVTTVKVIDPQRCSTCGCCISTCPNRAITIEERPAL